MECKLLSACLHINMRLAIRGLLSYTPHAQRHSWASTCPLGMPSKTISICKWPEREEERGNRREREREREGGGGSEEKSIQKVG